MALVGALGAGAVGIVQMLRPAASIDDYARYFRDDTMPLRDGQVSITFFGVSTLLFDDGETQLLVDAFFTRPSKAEFLSEMKEDVDAVSQFVGAFKMDRVKAVVVAHSHVDHAIDVPSVAELTGATIWGTESTLNIGRGGGVAESQLGRAVGDETIEVGAFTVRFVDSPHSQLPGVNSPGPPPTIDQPLRQPATNEQFAEGGNFNFVITHRNRTYVVVPSANFRRGGLQDVDADILFLGTALLGTQDRAFQAAYLDETIGATTPEIVVPLHWDDFLRPWSRGAARFNPRLIDKKPADGFDLVIDRTTASGAEFVVLQAGSRILTGG